MFGKEFCIEINYYIIRNNFERNLKKNRKYENQNIHKIRVISFNCLNKNILEYNSFGR